MHRFFLTPKQCREEPLRLTGSEAHHATKVLRVRRGESVTVLDGAGRELLCEVEDSARDHVSLRVIEQKTAPPPGCRLVLLQAIPKGKIIEDIIQKATELGVSRLIPLLSERVVSRLDEEDAAQKAEKWQGVAIEAVKQCGAAWLPKVEPPITPDEFIARREAFDLPLVASLQADARHARQAFRSFHDTHHRLPVSIAIWVGPEGDFSPGEMEAIKASGASSITLGPLVLRCETAAIYCLSILNYELRAPA
jgi:16S rRNA (uracil1498-N3)-methyltransferase